MVCFPPCGQFWHRSLVEVPPHEISRRSGFQHRCESPSAHQEKGFGARGEFSLFCFAFGSCLLLVLAALFPVVAQCCCLSPVCSSLPQGRWKNASDHWPRPVPRTGGLVWGLLFTSCMGQRGLQFAATAAPPLPELARPAASDMQHLSVPPVLPLVEAAGTPSGTVGIQPLLMFHSTQGAVPQEWRGTELLLPPAVASFYLTAPSISRDVRCLRSASLSSPACSGAACIPCYCARIRSIHGLTSVHRLQGLLHIWRGYLDSVSDPPSSNPLGLCTPGSLVPWTYSK